MPAGLNPDVVFILFIVLLRAFRPFCGGRLFLYAVVKVNAGKSERPVFLPASTSRTAVFMV
jgi:hypothetical protein